MTKIVTVSAIMGWDEDDIKKFESFMKKIEKYGWDFQIEDVSEEMDNGRDREDIFEWFNTAVEMMLEEMCTVAMEYINNNYSDDELEDVYFKIETIKDNSYDYVEVDETGKININCPFKMFKVSDFFDAFEPKFDKFVEKMNKFELMR